jgi:drug/metabolite transporter (DMT)-like permease
MQTRTRTATAPGHSPLYALAVGFGTAGIGFLLTGQFGLGLAFLALSATFLSLGLLVNRRRNRQPVPTRTA